MALTEEVEKEVKKLTKKLKEKGIKVIDDNSSISIKQPLIQAAPKPKIKTNSLNKFKSLYYHLLDSGLYIDPTLELEYDIHKRIPFDDAGDCNLTLSNEAYNANLTFTTLTAILQNSALLSFGPPGSGKTTASEFVISGVYNLPLSAIQEATIQGNPELTEEKMLAYIDLSSFIEKKEKIGVRKFMTSPGRIIDEVNRMPPSKSSLLMNILDRGWAKYNDKKIKATPGPLFATANGIDPGNYEMTPPFLDRFAIGIVKAELNPAFIGQFTYTRNNKIKFIEDKIVEPPQKINDKDIMNARKEIYFNTNIDSDLMNKIAHFLAELMSCDKAGKTPETKTKGNALYKQPGPLCQDCRYHGNDNTLCHTTENSLSARTISSIYAYSKALAWWRGNSQVEEEDIKYVLAHASWFKIRPTRSTLEKEEFFINDRKAMMYSLWDIASKSYDETISIFPEYERIVDVVTNFTTKKSKPSKQELEDMLHSAAKIDSPAKFPISTALKYMWQTYDRCR